ncbi:MAG: 16S rRNA (guanine(527)-N(7))-methyltransferase RsmG [Deltaproteobacteria bacterium]|nr:16S rRNA (guanine(527)-N(7))-methyltransferase RsmG [Deltaproteobacteria bacterium]
MQNQYQAFIQLLLTWNAKINLTAITDPKEIQVKHIEDCLSLLPHLGDATSVIDLGTGGGFPGIPLKIARPDLKVTMIEATRKKVSFLYKAIAELGLHGIQAIEGRAEDLKTQEKVGKADVVVSRATWQLKDFLPIALGYCHPKSRIFAMKGPRFEEELAAMPTACGTSHKVHPYRLSSGEERFILEFQVDQ